MGVQVKAKSHSKYHNAMDSDYRDSHFNNTISVQGRDTHMDFGARKREYGAFMHSESLIIPILNTTNL